VSEVLRDENTHFLYITTIMSVSLHDGGSCFGFWKQNIVKLQLQLMSIIIVHYRISINVACLHKATDCKGHFKDCGAPLWTHL